MAEPASAHSGRAQRNLRLGLVTGYLLLALGFFSGGYLLLPLLEGETRPAVSLERVKLPRPQPVEDFSLDDVGANVDASAYTRDRLLNQWTFMYFGYTHCPDVCRPTLALMTEVARRLRATPRWTAGLESTRLELVFVSVDPSRDTPAVVRDFLAAADADIIGLRGSEKQIADLSQQLGLLHLPGPADSQGSYLIDHPATILLIDPSAHLRAGFTFSRDAARIVELVSEIATQFDAEQKG